MPQPTQIQQRKELSKSIMNQVCNLLNISPLEYKEFQYKQGCAYLQSYIPKYPAIIDELLQNKIYWAWWRNEWLNRDEVYVLNVEILNIPNRWLLYKHLHDPHVLIQDIQPNKFVLGDSYATMMQQVINKGGKQ
jgi:hypothetical protein